MMGWYDGSFGWAGWLVMTVLMLTFWTLLIFGGLAIIRSVRRDDRPGSRGQDGPSDAQRFLDERFARGELDEDDYTRRRELLSASR
jgi:putative membrane protein